MDQGELRHVKSEDYHTEMDGIVFEHWFKNRLLPFVPNRACIVADRASYHTLLTEESKSARQQWKREELAQWILDHEGTDEEGNVLSLLQLLGDDTHDGPATHRRKGWSKQALWALAQEMRPKPQYLVHRWCAEFNVAHSSDIKVLLLPVAHPILNPVEVMWSQVKRYVRSHNSDFNMERIKSLAEDIQRAQGPTEWAASFNHTWRYATAQWMADELILDEEESADDVPEHSAVRREDDELADELNRGGEMQTRVTDTVTLDSVDRLHSTGQRVRRPNPMYAGEQWAVPGPTAQRSAPPIPDKEETSSIGADAPSTALHPRRISRPNRWYGEEWEL